MEHIESIEFTVCRYWHPHYIGKTTACIKKIVGCREWLLGNVNIVQFSTINYGENVIFNEIFVVDTNHYSNLVFYYLEGDNHDERLQIGKKIKILILDGRFYHLSIKYIELFLFCFSIDFGVDTISAGLWKDGVTIKVVRTIQWTEVPPSPYSVRVVITSGKFKYGVE